MSSLTTEKMAQLLDRLLAKSRAGECEWEPTAFPMTFRVPAAAGYVAVSKAGGKDPQFKLYAFDEAGNPIAGLTPVLLRDSLDTQALEEHNHLAELWTLAQQHVAGSPEKLDRLLQSFA